MAGFAAFAFVANGTLTDLPDLIQLPGLTSSTWTLINAPIRRPIENDEALLLAMNLL